MSNISEQIGGNIRLYRQTKSITLSEFAKMIHKSKSTISKYENGDISIDIETLFEVATALGISIDQLLQLDLPPSQPDYYPHVGHQKGYLYMFDGATNRIVRSLLKTTNECSDKVQHTTVFYNVPSFDQYDKCRSLYYGTINKQDFVTNYILQNQTNNIERLFMCFLNPLECSEKRFGLLSGLSSRTLLPVSAKCILSSVPLKEDEELMQSLLLTKEDLRLTKRFNMFVIDQLV